MRSWSIALFITGFQPVFAETAALPGCEPRPEVRQILDAKLASKNLQEMNFAERVAYRRQVLEDLIARYPREVEPYRRLLDATRDDETERLPELMDSWRKQAGQRPTHWRSISLALPCSTATPHKASSTWNSHADSPQTFHGRHWTWRASTAPGPSAPIRKRLRRGSKHFSPHVLPPLTIKLRCA